MRLHSVQIGNICLPTRVCDPRNEPDKSFFYVDISSIDRNLKNIGLTSQILGAEAPSRARKEILKGDVIVSTVRPNLNAVAIVPKTLDGQIASTGFCVLRPNSKVVTSKYLFYFTLTSRFIDELMSKVRGAHYPAVSDQDVRDVSLHLPTPSEQGKIVDILDQADALRKKRIEADATTTRILPTLFYNQFGDQALNPKGLPLLPLSDVCGEIYRYPSYYGIDYVDIGVPEVRGELLLDDGTIKLHDLRYISHDTASKFPRTKLNAGDLVMSVRGTIGKLAITPIELQGANITANLLRISPKRNMIVPEYLYAYLTSSSGQYGVTSITTNTTIQTIKASNFKNLMIMVPRYDVQQHFATLFNSVRNLARRQATSASNIESLFKTILHRAFNGDLTSKWREAHMKELLAEMELQAKYLSAEASA